jgi:hypothetical protein
VEEYALAVFSARRPPFPADELEQRLAARVAREEIANGTTARPVFSFVQCESTLRRPIGGRMVMRRRLQRLLEVAEYRNVDLPVLPLGHEENPGLAGSFRLLRLKDGTTAGHVEVQHISRVITAPKEVQLLDMRHGIIRTQALSTRESMALIEKVPGET